MTGPGEWGGRRAQAALRQVLQRDEGICWLCHHGGANGLDHVEPRSTHPHLTWDPANWRAVHRNPAGRPFGCNHPGCTCIGNTGRGDGRGDRPAYPPPTRDW